jgi:hypothetical protein
MQRRVFTGKVTSQWLHQTSNTDTFLFPFPASLTGRAARGAQASCQLPVASWKASLQRPDACEHPGISTLLERLDGLALAAGATQ